MNLLKEQEERKTSGKPFTDEEYAEAMECKTNKATH